jgi:hypothetical protein
MICRVRLARADAGWQRGTALRFEVCEAGVGLIARAVASSYPLLRPPPCVSLSLPLLCLARPPGQGASETEKGVCDREKAATQNLNPR